jgi:hypothetical protein
LTNPKLLRTVLKILHNMKTHHFVRLFSSNTSTTRRIEESCYQERAKILKSYPSSANFSAMQCSPHFQSWAETFYRRPHPELLSGAILDIIMTPGAGTGTSSLPVAIFLSEVIAQRVHRPEDGVLIIESLLASIQNEKSRMNNNSAFADEALEKADTILRAFYLANTSSCDLILENAVTQWFNSFKDNQEHKNGLDALGKSLLPPKEFQNRKKILDWPIPVMNLSLFERHITQNEYPLYGCTRFWFMHTHAIYSSSALARSILSLPLPSQTIESRAEALKHSGRVQVLSPSLAQDLTISMVDSLWSLFYASGNAACVFRILDIATLYTEFLEDPGIGEAFLMPIENIDTNQSNTLLPSAPLDLLDDPLSLMRFQASRHALFSLLRHLSTHTSVGIIINKHHEELEDKADLSGSSSTGEGIFTSFGEKRLSLLRHFRSTFTHLSEQAEKDGIGSGIWPQSMNSLFGITEGTKISNTQLIQEETHSFTSHHSAQIESVQLESTTNSMNLDLSSSIRPVKDADVFLSKRRSAGKQRR